MTEQNELQLGGKLGPRAAKLLSDAMVYTRQRLGPHQASLAQLILADFTNHVSDEVRGVMAPIWKQFADDEETPAELRPLFQSLATERGQAWAWIGGTATGAAAGASLSDLFSNLLAPVIHKLISNFPNNILSPESSAAMMARDIAKLEPQINLFDEAAKSGLSNERTRLLAELARSYPDVERLNDMWRRGIITRQDHAQGLRRLGYFAPWTKHIQDSAKAELSLPEISAMWNRNVLSEGEAIQLGRRLGYDETQVKRALEIGGEPLPPQELGEAFRRGFIDSQRFNRGIVQGPLRNEWFDVLEKLQFHRMSVVDAADAVNQGHLPASEGRRIAHEQGLTPNDFDVLLKTAGQPPGVEFAQEAWNRGFINEAQFSEMFLESRIKNRYLPLLKQMRVRLIPQETARLLYREGVYSRDDTITLLLEHGFSANDAAALVSLEDARRNETTKELTRAQIIDLYEEQLIERSLSVELLSGLGFSLENVELMMALADLKRSQKFINAAITRIRSAYVTGKLDESEASAQLDRLLIPSNHRDNLLAIWDIDRTTITKTLTASQIRQALNKDLISTADAMQRLIAQGYDQTDAEIYLQLTA